MKRLLGIWLLLFVSMAASALEIKQVRWGFDGQAVPERFNVLSILVANPSLDSFDGTLNLYKKRGMEQRVGAIFASRCYISSMTTRWVQFYVYVDNTYDEWQLEWGRSRDSRFDVPAPKPGPRAQVLLIDSESSLRLPSSFKEFPEELFPPTAAGTDALGLVLLDHAPRWERAKRQAFIDWIRAGGKVHLLKGADGNYPVFSDELSVLNSPVDEQRVGAGIVVRHDAAANRIARSDLGETETPAPDPKPNQPVYNSQLSERFFRRLASFSQPHYSWELIYLLAIAYVAIVGPLNMLAGRRIADYRLRIALLVGTIACFALFFQAVGRSGQRGASVVHTLSYARALQGDNYEVTQWINVFSARGAHYAIAHNAPHNIYATGQDYEAVNGIIQSGRDGMFLVDMPLFSRRALLHQAEMKGVPIPVQVASYGGSGMNRWAFSVESAFSHQIVESWAVDGNRIYGLQLKDGQLRISSDEPLDSIVSHDNEPPNVYYNQQTASTNVEAEFRKLVKPLIGWGLGANEKNYGEPMTIPTRKDRVQLFVFTRSPDTFSITGNQFGHEVGYVLYHVDLFPPGS